MINEDLDKNEVMRYTQDRSYEPTQQNRKSSVIFTGTQNLSDLN